METRISNFNLKGGAWSVKFTCWVGYVPDYTSERGYILHYLYFGSSFSDLKCDLPKIDM